MKKRGLAIATVCVLTALSVKLTGSNQGITVSVNTPKSVAAATVNTNGYQLSANKLVYGNWTLAVDAIVFDESTYKEKIGTVGVVIENNKGKDKPFDSLPSGSFLEVVGSSGKVYNLKQVSWVDEYNGWQEYQKWNNEKQGSPVSIGSFNLPLDTIVDSNETNFTELVYQDAKGNKINIPIQGITATVKGANLDPSKGL